MPQKAKARDIGHGVHGGDIGKVFARVVKLAHQGRRPRLDLQGVTRAFFSAVVKMPMPSGG